MQLAHPDWWAGSDDDHERSTATRRALLAELLAEPDTVVAPTHFGEAFGHVSPDPDGPGGMATRRPDRPRLAGSTRLSRRGADLPERHGEL